MPTILEQKQTIVRQRGPRIFQSKQGCAPAAKVTPALSIANDVSAVDTAVRRAHRDYKSHQ